MQPSPNESNGRNSRGRFTKGNHGGPGNPYARRVSDFRNVLMEAVTDEDLYEIARSLVEKGKAGDVMAAREVLDRLMGKAKATLTIENQPERSEEELHTELRTLLERNPGLAAEITRLGRGCLLLPANGEGGYPPNCE